MDNLPAELWSLIASTDVQTYHALSQVVRGLHLVRPVGATDWEDYFTVMKVDKNGDRSWELHGKLHRGGDQPALVRKSGHQVWYQHGRLHRGGDKPSIILTDHQVGTNTVSYTETTINLPLSLQMVAGHGTSTISFTEMTTNLLLS